MDRRQRTELDKYITKEGPDYNDDDEDGLVGDDDDDDGTVCPRCKLPWASCDCEDDFQDDDDDDALDDYDDDDEDEDDAV